MKLLLENWRRFITENEKTELCLYHYTKGLEHALVLYHPKPLNLGFAVRPITDIGGIHIKKTDEPCIPITYEVSWVSVRGRHQGQNYGKMLYDLAFYVANSDGHGLTSDHSVGTMERAKKLWKSIESSPEYEKRKTEKGNDEFDYDESTPDLYDDCGEAIEDMDFSSATDHSLFKKNFKEMEPMYMQMSENHNKFKPSWGDVAANWRVTRGAPLEQYLLDTTSISIDV